MDSDRELIMEDARSIRERLWRIAQLALRDFGDVVLIDGSVALVEAQHLDDALAKRLRSVSAIDAWQAPGFVYLRLTPWRIQAWWSGSELARPTIMRDGGWFTSCARFSPD